VTVALDLEVTPALRAEWLARELVRLVQDARKAAGLEVTDRIALGIETTGAPAEAVRVHRDVVATETLARSVSDGAIEGYRQEGEVDGMPVVVTLRRD
jgi:isoleucyl-tRNA synthetase